MNQTLHGPPSPCSPQQSPCPAWKPQRPLLCPRTHALCLEHPSLQGCSLSITGSQLTVPSSVHPLHSTRLNPYPPRMICFLVCYLVPTLEISSMRAGTWPALFTVAHGGHSLRAFYNGLVMSSQSLLSFGIKHFFFSSIPCNMSLSKKDI